MSRAGAQQVEGVGRGQGGVVGGRWASKRLTAARRRAGGQADKRAVGVSTASVVWG